MLLQLPHEANYLVVDHVAHFKFDVSSRPKEMIYIGNETSLCMKRAAFDRSLACI